MRTNVSYSFLISGVVAKWREELSDGARFYTVPDVATWAGVQPDALEAAARLSDEFEVTPASDMPEQYVRVPRTGKGATGYWPFLRLRDSQEIRDLRAIREGRENAAGILAGYLSAGLPVGSTARPTVTFDSARRVFVIAGLSAEDVATGYFVPQAAEAVG